MLAALLVLLATATSGTADLPEVQTLGDVLHAFRPASRIRVVNVWATWCAPCVAEIGDIQALADKLGGTPVEVIGVFFADALPRHASAGKKKLQRFLPRPHHPLPHRLYYRPPTEP